MRADETRWVFRPGWNKRIELGPAPLREEEVLGDFGMGTIKMGEDRVPLGSDQLRPATTDADIELAAWRNRHGCASVPLNVFLEIVKKHETYGHRTSV